MSWAATAYVKNLRCDKDGKRLTKGHKLVLFVLADYHNEERGDAWTSLRHMAKESLYSLTGLIRALLSLEKGGIIQIVRDQNAAQTRTTNRYIFQDLEPVNSMKSTPALLYPVQQAAVPSTAGVLYPVQHIFPKNLSNQSIQKQEKSVASGLPVDNCKDAGEESERFERFTKVYPHRGGKPLERKATQAIFSAISPDDQELAIKAAGHYEAASKSQGLLAKDQKRFLRDSSGHEPWRDWIEPASLALTERAPPIPPKTDPIARGHWHRLYGNPK